MRFVKFKENRIDIIKNKEYKIEHEAEKQLCFVDEDNDIQSYDVCDDCLEIIDRPVMVRAWDADGNGKLSKELIQDLGESFKYRYMCRNTNTNEIAGWKNIEYIAKPKQELTLEQRIEKLEQQLNNK